MSVGAEFEACARNLDESIKREMLRKGDEATKKLREIEAEVVLAQPGHGIKHKSLPNRSSAPFETPAPQSGELRTEWDDETIQDGTRVTSRIKTTDEIKYAVYLDEGRKMKARPFANRIKVKAEPEIYKIFDSDYRIQL